MAVTYSTADIDAVVAMLETSLSTGLARIRFADREEEYRSVIDIRNAIGYFKGLYPTATDAPTVSTGAGGSAVPRIRTLLFNGSKGF